MLARTKYTNPPFNGCQCPNCRSSNTKRNGSYRTPQHGRVQQYVCKTCQTPFSLHTIETRTIEHRPELNQEVVELFRKGLSEREIAQQLGCARLTVRRKLAKYL